MKIIDLPTPFKDSREGAEVNILVLHYTGTQTAGEALEILSGKDGKEVSSHYTVDEDGVVYAHVPEAERAWHAGISYWRGVDGVNASSIGIEIINPGHEFGYRRFPQSQMDAVAKLCQGILSRHAIPARNVIAHSDIAPARKEDPGELFDWPWLAKQGVGLWPNWGEMLTPNKVLATLGDRGALVASIQRRLAEYGYGVPQNGMFDDETHKVAIAFQRHFRPENIGGEWDSECDGRLDLLLRAVK